MNNPASMSRLSGIGNRKSVFEETVIPAVETAVIFPLECMHTSFDVNTF